MSKRGQIVVHVHEQNKILPPHDHRGLKTSATVPAVRVLAMLSSSPTAAALSHRRMLRYLVSLREIADSQRNLTFNKARFRPNVDQRILYA